MALQVLTAVNKSLLAAAKEIADQVIAIGDAVTPDPETGGVPPPNRDHTGKRGWMHPAADGAPKQD